MSNYSSSGLSGDPLNDNVPRDRDVDVPRGFGVGEGVLSETDLGTVTRALYLSAASAMPVVKTPTSSLTGASTSHLIASR